jgi:hypothetical protein
LPLPVEINKFPKFERKTGLGLRSFIKVEPSSENRNANVFKMGCRLFRTGMDRNDIIYLLREISNGLPENEFTRTVERAESYAKK